MVHVFCPDEKCKRVIHLDDSSHWNFKGRVKCLHCGSVMEVEIKDGKIVSLRKV